MSLILQAQKHYHSFIICQTKRIPIAQQFPNAVFSSNNTIIRHAQSTHQNQQALQYNYSFNAVKYTYRGKLLLIGQTQFMIPMLSEQEKQNIINNGMLCWQRYSLAQNLKFYFSLSSDKFAQVFPFVFTHKYMIFEISKQWNKHENFKDISNSMTISNHKQEFFHFDSEYSLLSDMHFPRALVSGFSQLSCYVKNKGEYRHIIGDQLLKFICKLYPLPHL